MIFIWCSQCLPYTILVLHVNGMRSLRLCRTRWVWESGRPDEQWLATFMNSRICEYVLKKVWQLLQYYIIRWHRSHIVLMIRNNAMCVFVETPTINGEARLCSGYDYIENMERLETKCTQKRLSWAVWQVFANLWRTIQRINVRLFKKCVSQDPTKYDVNYLDKASPPEWTYSVYQAFSLVLHLKYILNVECKYIPYILNVECMYILQ